MSLPDTITREEQYFAYMAGNTSITLPEPITRKEQYLHFICTSGVLSGATPEQIESAVNNYLSENPVKGGATLEEAAQIKQNADDIETLVLEKINKSGHSPNMYLGTDDEGNVIEKSASAVPDKSINEEKLTEKLKNTLGIAELDIYGFTADDYTSVDITEQFTPGVINSWNDSENKGNGVVLSPVIRMPQKLIIINNNTSDIKSTYTRFLDNENTDIANQAENDTEPTKSNRWNPEVGPGETKIIYTHEWGRPGYEYIQIRWQNGTFKNWEGKFRVIAYYTDKRPEYKNELVTNDGFEHDVEIKWCASVYGTIVTSQATLFAIVPFVPGRKYTIKGGNWNTSIATNISSALALYDDAVLDNYYPGLMFNNAAGPIQPPMRKIIDELEVIESGAKNGGKGIVTYTCPDPSETNDYPKWVAFAMSKYEKPEVEDTYITYSHDSELISAWTQNRMLDMITGYNTAWHYVTVFNELIDRLANTTNFVKPYTYYNDAGSRHAAMLSPDCPMTGETLTVFGDSISDAYGGHDLASDYFIAKICREFGMRIDNRAASGSNLCISTDNYASVSGVYKLQEYLAEVSNGEIEQSGYILIEFGANCYDTYVGNASDTSEIITKSYYGAAKYFIEQLRTNSPNSVFGFILPHDVAWGNNNTAKDSGVPRAREAIRDVCEEYRVPYFDMYKDSGISSEMLPDGVHIKDAQSQNLYYHAIRRFVMGL